ncbi:MAG: hypothetical protein JSS91_09925 [Bacteroidetes bacterium]|nr:hypothetical protein [Bacteroidota bacterium]
MPVSYFFKKAGLITLSGSDAVDFINRMSTNDLRNFRKGEFRYTVLTTDRGRIIDLVNFIDLGDKMLFLTSADYEDRIISHLEKYIIMDDVSLKKSGDEHLLISIFTDNPGEFSSEKFNIECEKNKAYVINENDILFCNDLLSPAVNIICSEKHIDVYRNILKDYELLNCGEYEFMRISSLTPEGKNELNEQINPMECGLDKFISFTKGCYIGQEVIARIESQSKIPKQMVKINSDSEFKPEDRIYNEEDKESGFVTSVIPYAGKYSGLGFIRNTELEGEKSFKIRSGEKEIKIEISLRDTAIKN